MKNFLQKKSIMTTLIVLSVLLLAFYIFMLARPISYGMNYTYIPSAEEVEETGASGRVVVKFLNDKEVLFSSKMVDSEAETEISITYTLWYIRNGNKIYTSITEFSKTSFNSEEAFNNHVNELKQNDSAAWENIWNGNANGYLIELNAFKATMTISGETQNMTNSGIIWFAVLVGLIEIALITFSILSIIFVCSKSKKEEVHKENENTISKNDNELA